MKIDYPKLKHPFFPSTGSTIQISNSQLCHYPLKKKSSKYTLLLLLSILYLYIIRYVWYNLYKRTIHLLFWGVRKGIIIIIYIPSCPGLLSQSLWAGLKAASGKRTNRKNHHQLFSTDINTLMLSICFIRHDIFIS